MHFLLDMLKVALALSWWWLVGVAVLDLQARSLPSLRFHATAMLIGLGVVCIELFLFGLIGWSWSVPLLVAVLLPLVVLAAMRRWRSWWSALVRCTGSVAADDSRSPIRLLAVVVAGLLLTEIVAAMLVPSGLARNPDGYSFYLLKARMFFVDGGVRPYLEHHEALAYTVPDHPPLVPLSIEWLYLAVGRVDERLAVLINAVFLACGAALVYALAQERRMSSAVAAIFTALFCAMLFGYVIDGVAYTDLAVAVYLLLGASFTMAFLDDGRKEYAMVAAGAFGLVMWTKNEGTAFYYASVVALAVVTITTRLKGGSRRPPLRWLFALVVVPYVVIAPWVIARVWFQVPLGNGNVGNILSPSGFLEIVLQRGAPLLLWLSIRAVVLWHGLLILACILVVANVFSSIRHSESRSWRTWITLPSPSTVYLYCLIVVAVVGLWLGMLTSPDPLASLIPYATPRLASQLTALLFILLIYQLCNAAQVANHGQRHSRAASSMQTGSTRSDDHRPLVDA